jgi:hypothetical protein
MRDAMNRANPHMTPDTRMIGHRENPVSLSRGARVAGAVSGSDLFPIRFRGESGREHQRLVPGARRTQGPFGTYPPGSVTAINIERASVYTSMRLQLQATDVVASQLGSQGYKTGGDQLGNLLDLLNQQGIKTQLRAGELIAVGGAVGQTPVSIPLFSSSLGAGGGQVAEAAGEYMFKGGTAASVTAQVAQLGTSDSFKLQLKTPVSFSEYFYDRLYRHVQDTNVGELKTGVTNILNAQETLFSLDGSVEKRAADAVGFVDPLNYAGSPKLGRHHLGSANQMILEVTDEKFIELIRAEKSASQAHSTGFRAGERAPVASLHQSHNAAKKAVLDHLKSMEGRGGREAELAKRLNLAWASQSGEWIFHDSKDVLNRSRNPNRLFIKMTTADVKELSILPGQDLYNKQRQFHLSRAAVAINKVQDLPAAVAGIMGYSSKTMKGIRHDVHQLAGKERAVALGRRTVGVQFLDSRLSEAFFGDSGSMMSGGLIQELDRDPLTGFSRHTVTHKINLKQVDALQSAAGDLDLRGIFRTDLAGAINAHKHRMDNAGTIRFEQGFDLPLLAHQEQLDSGRVRLGSPGALHMSPGGGAVLGEHVLNASEVAQKDLSHANDMLRKVQSRGLDPAQTRIIGARLLRGSGQIELMLAEKGITKTDSGYIFGGHRVSAGGVIGETQEQAILKAIDVDQKHRGVGLVFGELGLHRAARDSGKASYGFNTTLLSNLAEIISERGDEAAARTLVQKMGGRFEREVVGGKSKIQFAALGSNIEGIDDGSVVNRITDEQFGTKFNAMLGDLESVSSRGYKKALGQATFAIVDLDHILPNLPGYKNFTDYASQQQKTAAELHDGVNAPLVKLLRSFGYTDVAAQLRGTRGKFKTAVIKSIGGDIGVRAEEPLAKFGGGAIDIRVREAMTLSESMDFARTQAGGYSTRQVMDLRKNLFKDLIDSHPHLFKKDDELSLIFQRSGDMQTFKQGERYSKIQQAFSGKEVGQLATLTSNQREAQFHTTLKKSMSIAELRDKASRQAGKVDITDVKSSILGMVSDSAGGSEIAKLSDQMILVQGPNGPMAIPSPKSMFKKEEGFLRLPGGSSDFDNLETSFWKSIEAGRSGEKQSKSLYLSILQDVETMENSRLQEEKVQLASSMEGRLNRLYKVMAANTVAKQGLFYKSAIDPGMMAMSGRMRLQTAPGVELFEVGLTRGALENMHRGGGLEVPVNQRTRTGGLHGQSFDDIMRRLTSPGGGDVYINAFREPIAGGRQMMALKVKLLNESDLSGAAAGKFSFNESAFLHQSMVKYGMEGDFDKDSVNLFRLMSMDDEGIAAIHRGQTEQMGGILDSLKGSRRGLLAEGLTGGGLPTTMADVQAILSNIESTTAGGEGAQGTVRNFTFDAMMEIVEPKHRTPIIESYFRGRSYVDHMMSQIMDVQATEGGRNVVKENLLTRLGEGKDDNVRAFLDQASDLFLDGPGARGGRFATYNYTDARNITKYMLLKKKAHGADTTGAEAVMDALMDVGSRMRGSTADDIAYQKSFMDDLLNRSSNAQSDASRMVDNIAEDLLVQADMLKDNRQMMKELGAVDPQTATIMHKLAADRELSGSAAENYSKLLAKRMVFTAAMAEQMKIAPGTGIGMPGESIMRNLSSVVRGMFSSGRPGDFELPSAFAMVDMQAQTGEIDELLHENVRRRMSIIKENNISNSRGAAVDAAGDLVRGSGDVTMPRSSWANSLISGEFFAKISQTKYFKPGAAIVGGLAGLEVIKSAIDRFSPGNVPVTMHNSAGSMPPPPMISSPQDPTFHMDAMPNTKVARVAKSEGMRNSVGISGKMDNPIDFRGAANKHMLNNGYVPNIQGSFRSNLNDTMSRREISQFVGDKMNSAF